MGTRFRTMLAPINASTGDGRRFAEKAITLADLPMPFEWARSREGGHDGAVVVGAVQEAAVLSVKDAIAGEWVSAETAKGMDPAALGVWAKGELFDGVDREAMPRLAEDVAEAMHLIGAGTLGPSVDLDSFEGVPVMPGSDEPVTYEDIEAHFEEHGTEPNIELLITAGRVRAATLVSIPAFAETSRPLELIADTEPALVAESGRTINTHCVNCGDTRGGPVGHEISECTWDSKAAALALVASVSTLTRPTAAAFDTQLTAPTPITYDYETGMVYGHIATWKTCHVGYEGVCITPPREPDTYAAFNRFPVETEDGTVWAGRITAGGRHAGLSLNASAAMSHYDGMVTVAHVRAYADEFGIAVAGVIEPGLDEGTRAILSRRKVSGDWRETPAGLSLVEVLALSPGPRAHSEPGFPVAETFSRSGRQVALTASFGPDPEAEQTALIRADFTVDPAVLAREIVKAQEARSLRAELAATVDSDVKARRESARTELLALVGED